MALVPENVTFFKSPAELRKWFKKHHRTEQALWVGFYKRGSGKPSITWPESVDEALCVGWIDGIRKNIDADSYAIRFTPRRATSIWSAVNIKRVRALTDEGRMLPAGLNAFEARRENKSGIYSYEQRPAELPKAYATALARNKAAAAYYKAQAPWYRRTVTWWVISAKKEETRLKRLATLIEQCARGRTIGPLSPKQKSE
jgi:uncharacterized protein YdeI (YjbR/CyaY-like superfamily)